MASGCAGLRYDTMIARVSAESRSARPGAEGPGLRGARRDHDADHRPDRDGQAADHDGAGTPIRAGGDYAGADADITLRLMHALEPQLRAARPRPAVSTDVEMPLVPVLARMELAGILVDPEFLQRLGRRLDEQIARAGAATSTTRSATSSTSTRRSSLREVLFNELKLPPCAQDQDGLLGRRRGAGELRGHASRRGYAAGVSPARQAEIHLCRWPAGADRSRRSPRPHVVQPDDRRDGPPQLVQPQPAKYPRAHRGGQAHPPGVPGGPRHATCSRPTTRRSSCASWRTSRTSRRWSRRSRHDEDIHAATAAQLFSVPLDEVTPEQRRLAKTVNFAVLYGQSAFGLARVHGHEQ